MPNRQTSLFEGAAGNVVVWFVCFPCFSDSKQHPSKISKVFLLSRMFAYNYVSLPQRCSTTVSLESNPLTHITVPNEWRGTQTSVRCYVVAWLVRFNCWAERLEEIMNGCITQQTQVQAVKVSRVFYAITQWHSWNGAMEIHWFIREFL